MKKKRITTIILVFILLTGLCLLLYPKVSSFWNSLHQSRAVYLYARAVEEIDEETYGKWMEEAYAYNRTLLERKKPFELTGEQAAIYPEILDVTENGIMGYVEIPCIDVLLPIYHGTSEGVLQIGVGHTEWSSLPVGGDSTHSVLSGHRGLPSSRLFTDLDELQIGDIFIVHVLDERLGYEVDQILTVLPEDTSALAIEPGQDLCTLITCTPYGVNTHRLLVRGHRVELTEEELEDTLAKARRIEPEMLLLIAAAGVLLAVLVLVRIRYRKKRPGKEKRDNEEQ